MLRARTIPKPQRAWLSRILRLDRLNISEASGCTGWDPNSAEMAVADNIMGPWTVIGDPCTGTDADKTFFAQSTYVQPVVGADDLYLALFDR